MAPAPTLSSRVAYKDRSAALKWLEKAFEFKPTLVATDRDGEIIYAEMEFGNGVICLGGEWGMIKAPDSVGGANTQTLVVQLERGLDAHCERARAAGGRIIQEPTDQFDGDRTYRVADPQGHIWAFEQKVREVTPEQLEAAVPGTKIWKPVSRDSRPMQRT